MIRLLISLLLLVQAVILIGVAWSMYADWYLPRGKSNLQKMKERLTR